MKMLSLIGKTDIGSSGEVNSVNLRDLWRELGSKQEFANFAKNNIVLFDENVDYVRFDKKVKANNATLNEYIVTLDTAKHIAMLQRNEKGKEIRQDFIDYEKSSIVPNFGDPAAAARAWAEQYEARQLAERTKAEIGSRREATSMATASVATRKAKKLEVMLDESQEWASIKKMEIRTGESFDWRRLKKASKSMNLPPRKIHDANYGEVNSYHSSVWLEVYGIDIAGGQNG